LLRGAGSAQCREVGGDVAVAEGIAGIRARGEFAVEGRPWRRENIEVRGRGYLAVGRDKLCLAQRQAIDGVDLDDIDDPAGREAGSDLIGHHRRQSAIPASREEDRC